MQVNIQAEKNNNKMALYSIEGTEGWVVGGGAGVIGGGGGSIQVSS